MKLSGGWFLLVFAVFAVFCAQGQKMDEDTSTNQPFFKASHFKSACNVGVGAEITQILTTKAGMNVSFALNWVINHKFVVTAQYHTLTTQNDIKGFVEPGNTAQVPLTHHYAGLGFSYILFSNKLFSFQPELIAGWCSAKYTTSGTTYRHDYGAVTPAIYGIYNVTQYFRMGVGLNYRAVLGSNFNGLKPMDLSGVAGVVFFRVGTF